MKFRIVSYPGQDPHVVLEVYDLQPGDDPIQGAHDWMICAMMEHQFEEDDNANS